MYIIHGLFPFFFFFFFFFVLFCFFDGIGIVARISTRVTQDLILTRTVISYVGLCAFLLSCLLCLLGVWDPSLHTMKYLLFKKVLSSHGLHVSCVAVVLGACYRLTVAHALICSDSHDPTLLE